MAESPPRTWRFCDSPGSPAGGPRRPARKLCGVRRGTPGTSMESTGRRERRSAEGARARVRSLRRVPWYRQPAGYRDCFRSTSTVDTYSRTYRGTYSLTTHEYRHYTSQTDTNLDRGAHVATRRRWSVRRFAPARVTFLTVTFRHGPRISLPSPRWLRPRTSPAAVRAIATTTMLPTRAGR